MKNQRDKMAAIGVLLLSVSIVNKATGAFASLANEREMNCS
jgi:hypothetical protein